MSKSYLFTYCYDNGNGGTGIGSITITQSVYHPIDQDILEDAVRIVRENLKLPESQKIVPLAFHRFEMEQEDE